MNGVPSFALAVAEAVSQIIDSRSDRMARVEADRLWPMPAAMDALATRRSDLGTLTVGLLSQFKQHAEWTFTQPVESDPWRITALRNEPAIARPTLVLIGDAGGQEEAGLKRVRRVRLADVVAAWGRLLDEYVSAGYAAAEADLRKRIARAVCQLVNREQVHPLQADAYFAALHGSHDLTLIQRELPCLGLLPDDSLIGAGNTLKRLQANRKVRDVALHAFPEDQYERLRASGVREVRALLDYAGDADVQSLRRTELTAVEAVLEPPPVPPPPEGPEGDPTSTEYDFLDFLGDSRVGVSERREGMEQMASLLADEGLKREARAKTISVADWLVVLACPAAAISEEWTTESTGAGRPVQVRSDALGFVSVDIGGLSGGPIELETAFIRDLAGQLGVAPELERFLRAREILLGAAHLLACGERDLLALLVASPVLLGRAGEYVDSWAALLAAADNASQVAGGTNLTAFALLEATWRRQQRETENLETLHIRWDDNYLEAAFAPWHAWRLSPLVAIAGEVRDSFEVRPEIVGRAVWALDRSIPAYRALELGEGMQQLFFQSASEGVTRFAAQLGTALPPSYASGKRIRRTQVAYLKVHRWASEETLTGLLINPPQGRLAKGAFNYEALSLALLRERGLDGLDFDDISERQASTHDISSLEEWLSGARTEQDLCLAFLRGNPAQYRPARGGAHATIRLELSDTGVAPGTGSVQTPRINLGLSATSADGSPSPMADPVNLIYRMSGRNEVSIGKYDLALSEQTIANVRALVERSGWTVVAVPGTVASFELADSQGRGYPRIAEFEEGGYTCFVFAQTVLPLEAVIESKLRQLPVTSNLEARGGAAPLLLDLASRHPQKLLDVAANRYGIEELLGLIGAETLARLMPAQEHPEALQIFLNLDDSLWTREWLPRGSQRADFLVVRVSGDPDERRPIHIRVVEAKARSGEFRRPTVTGDAYQEVYRGAIEQVEVMMAELIQLVNPGSSLIQRIRWGALAERIAATVAGMYLSSADKHLFGTYFKHINALFADPQSAIADIEGLAFICFLDAFNPIAVEHGLVQDVDVVATSAQLLDDLLNQREIRLLRPDRAEGVSASPLATEGQPDDTEERHVSVVREDVSRVEDEVIPKKLGPVATSAEQPEFLEDLKRRVWEALRLRSDAVRPESDAPIGMRLGPTFVALTFGVRLGADLAPLQRVSADIARDASVETIEIANASRQDPFYAAGGDPRIEVLVPRPQREFPVVPDGPRGLAEGSGYLPIAIGSDVGGNPVLVPVSDWPHALVAGSTSSGKTTFVRSLLQQLSANAPTHVSAVVVDGKGEGDYLEFERTGILDAKFPAVLDSATAALDVFRWLAEVEMPRRRELIQDASRALGRRVDARGEFVAAANEGRTPLLRPLVIVVDEFNQLMLAGGPSRDAFVDGVTTVAQTARSLLIHLVLSTQRPDRSVLPGVVKANLPTRFAFRLPTPADAITVLGHGGAERLLGSGDMIMQLNGQPDVRLQGYFLS